jgi:TonB family protein
MVPPLRIARVLRRTSVLFALILVLFSLSAISASPQQTQIETNEAGRKIKTRVAPEYPELARRLKIQGTARVQFTVTPEGAVKEVKELGGNPLLLDSLVKAVKQWKYETASKESTVEVKAAFTAN